MELKGPSQPDCGPHLPQTPTPISSMPVTPAGTSSWMPTAWPSMCGSTQHRHWLCSRRIRTSTSSTGQAARGRLGRCYRLGNWSSALGMGLMASLLWQRHPTQPQNVHRLLSEQASLLLTVYLRMGGPFPRENKFDYFLMLPTAPCGGVGWGAGSCSTQEPVGTDLLLGKARLSLLRNGTGALGPV